MAVVVTDIPLRRTVLAFALARERHYVLMALDPLPGHVSAEVVGVGAARAAAGAAGLFRRDPRPDLVVSVGVCGGLRDGQKVGDLVVPAEVAGPDGRVWPCAPLFGPALGRLVSVERVAGDPAEKRELGRRFGADGVDMEAAAVAEACAAAGVPFAAVKGVSDPVDVKLPPELERIAPDGRVRLGRLVWAALRRPSLVGELRQVGHDFALACGAAGIYLAALCHPPAGG